ncbi:MAG: ABC transporter [Acidobacteria bacterium]|nr:MAG: ABC transporter [Acidobacteriota bacterium]
MNSPAIETERLSKVYRSGRGIRELNLTVEHGEVFGFLGPNGAGKTTTIRTLTGFLHPTGGTARILGLDIESQSLEIRRRIGNLPDDYSFDEKTTGSETLKFFSKVRRITDDSYANELSERFSADLDTRISQLSRGNRQKIALILTMFHQPELLIFDEPTGGLDPLMQDAFASIVDEWRGEGRTVFISSHDLSEVERMCDRVGIIRDGQLVAIERVDDLIQHSLREVSITFAGPPDAAQFTRIPGVSDLTADGHTLSFRVSKSVDAVLKAAASHEVVDLEVKHPSLEEIFLTFYGDD